MCSKEGEFRKDNNVIIAPAQKYPKNVVVTSALAWLSQFAYKTCIGKLKQQLIN